MNNSMKGLGLAAMFVLLGCPTKSFGFSAHPPAPDNCDALYPNQGYVNSPSGGCVKYETAALLLSQYFRDQVKHAEERRDETQKRVGSLCGSAGPRQFSSNSEECQQARQEFSLAQQGLYDIKAGPIKIVRAFENVSAFMKSEVSRACSSSPHQAPNAERCRQAKDAFANSQKMFERISDSWKKEVYGCKRWYETPLECANVTLEGAKLSLSNWQRDVFGPKSEKEGPFHNQIETSKPQQFALKDKIHAAKQEALNGHLKDCKRADNGFSCLDKDGQRHSVDYTVYKGWELAQGKAVKSKPEEGFGQLVAKEKPKKERRSGVAGLSDDVRNGFDLANRLKDDLRDTGKWPSDKLNPSNINKYDPDLRLKYEEQMRLANALKSNPGADPADLARALNLKSDPIKALGVPPIITIGKSEGASSSGGRVMVVADQNGNLVDKKVKGCDRSQGFVAVEKAGVSYCQQVPQAAKTLAKIKDGDSKTGIKIVRRCPPDQPFQPTNWAGPGSGECLRAKEKKQDSGINDMLQMTSGAKNAGAQPKNDSRTQKKCRKIVGVSCL